MEELPVIESVGDIVLVSHVLVNESQCVYVVFSANCLCLLQLSCGFCTDKN